MLLAQLEKASHTLLAELGYLFFNGFFESSARRPIFRKEPYPILVIDNFM